MKRFAIMGVGGFIAPRHLDAVRDTGSQLVAACDPKDSVGVLDQYSFDVRFFTETERFDRHLELLRRGPRHERLDYLSVCSPNYLHDAHCRLGLRAGVDVICEKPVVINPWNVDALLDVERETGRRVHPVLQLRLHDKIVGLRNRVLEERGVRHDVTLTYVTARGPWYDVSWKGNEEKSGGIPANIGVHIFDMLLWTFGPPQGFEVHLRDPRRWSGTLHLERARVRWLLSVDAADLPVGSTRSAFRAITVDGTEIDFSDGFTALHTRAYESILAGNGLSLADARPAIDLVSRLRKLPRTEPRSEKIQRKAGRAEAVSEKNGI